ncbi:MULTISPECIES: response regulator transcription factor [Mycobacteroides]|uniref:Response regulator transcription factor n=1 Tax=Mycobacteroides chelonae TaxID=1774 RepID=A0A1S1LQ69_MYCCH|nr:MULTISPECIES: response regulator transcription factor [Mycobacteroides]KRQ18888.1 chemotaxis protein CheY [Mycobacteroides sp. H003]KRQ21319.1 chemotaxis protein CheY [Mycobacteroides sp. H092]KRQ44369.1 chemotaxis protein CheY [Mycobacteroides sp. H101]KRQ52399.1 chemotaxis protein CheY [Mycobacteroides sp. H063]KRQ57159.1 chemotaxis protein CheY [Mycobacteroides sp. HXVII]
MSQQPYVVVIIDDHELFAEGLELLLARDWSTQFTVGGRTRYVEEAAALAIAADADLAIVDLTMPPLGGVAAIRHIKARHPRTRILALSGTDEYQLAEDALRAGADGFLSKTVRPDALVGPLQTIASGLRVIDPTFFGTLLSNARKPSTALISSLAQADLKLWVLLASGMETTDIASRMVVSERTAKRMVASLLNKLGVGNRIAAAALAGRCGLLDDT